LNKSLLGLILITLFSLSAIAQSNKEYKILSKFKKLSIVGGPVLYNKAKIYPQYGNYIFENKPIWGFNAGLEYDFYPDRKWSFVTGILVALEHVYNIQCTFKKEDIYTNFNEDYTDEFKMSAMPSFSAPLLLRLNIQISQKTFANFLTGLKVMYFPAGNGELTVVFHNEDDTEAREEFHLSADSPENSFQGSFVIGTGLSFAINKVLLKSNLVYVMNFQNTMTGNYMFYNLLSSPPAGGDYELSGNYLGLWLSVTIAKKKIKE